MCKSIKYKQQKTALIKTLLQCHWGYTRCCRLGNMARLHCFPQRRESPEHYPCAQEKRKCRVSRELLAVRCSAQFGFPDEPWRVTEVPKSSQEALHCTWGWFLLTLLDVHEKPGLRAQTESMGLGNWGERSECLREILCSWNQLLLLGLCVEPHICKQLTWKRYVCVICACKHLFTVKHLCSSYTALLCASGIFHSSRQQCNFELSQGSSNLQSSLFVICSICFLMITHMKSHRVSEYICMDSASIPFCMVAPLGGGDKFSTLATQGMQKPI